MGLLGRGWGGAQAAAAGLRSPAHARGHRRGLADGMPLNDRRAMEALIATANGACARAQRSPATDGARERGPENACLRRLPFGQPRSRAKNQSKP